jgi:hypothetical protein
MRPNDVEPGELCDSCGVAIDARTDVVQHGTRFYCDDKCRRDREIAGAEQMGLEARNG